MLQDIVCVQYPTTLLTPNIMSDVFVFTEQFNEMCILPRTIRGTNRDTWITLFTLLSPQLEPKKVSRNSLPPTPQAYFVVWNTALIPSKADHFGRHDYKNYDPNKCTFECIQLAALCPKACTT